MRNFPHLRDIAYYDIEKTLFWTLHLRFGYDGYHAVDRSDRRKSNTEKNN